MRETAFIEQNEAKWREFEQILEGQRHDPEKLNELFIQVTDDLSYARTFYPNRSVRVYLNGLAQRIFSNIYKNKKSRRSRFVSFWSDELPRLLFDARKDLLLSFFIFSLAVAIGVLSCSADPDFLRVILGDSYVEMTEENIRSGDPMAVYKERGEFNIFLGITLHNLVVAFQTFIMGIFYAIGTIGSLLYNGIMLGAFQYFFIEKGLFWESFLAVWMHGAFEISSIVIAGAAGITVGRGLVFPGTLTRLRSFQLAARRGMSIMAGTVPLFIIAGFNESYITRHTEFPDVLRGTYIFFCFAVVFFYFVYYPRMKAKKGFSTEEEAVRLSPDVDRSIDFSPVKTTGILFTDAFIFLRTHFKPIAWAAAGGAAFYCAGAFLAAAVPAGELFSIDHGIFGTLQALPEFFVNKNHPWLFPLTTVAIAVVAFTAQHLVARRGADFIKTNENHEGKTAKIRMLRHAIGFFKVLIISILFSFLLYKMDWYTVALVWFFFPLLYLWAQITLSEGEGLVKGLGRTFELSAGVFGQMLGLFFTLLLCGTLFFLILDTGVLWFLLEIISMNFFLTEANAQGFSNVLITFITFFVLLMIFALWAVGSGLQYYSTLEVHEANFLKEKLMKIGKRQRIRGMDRES
jgi:uncharacterized membrane protein SpoIIM required for sporulation